MKLVSFAASGRNSYGAVVGDGIVDLGRRLGDRYPTLRAAIAGDALERRSRRCQGAAPDIALSQVTLLPPITDPDKIICAGRNYRAHAAEAGGAPPENPQVFLRLVNTLVAHDQPMVCPKISGDFDYEGELALIIGKPGRHIAKADALSHIFGYTCFNDGSIRDIQFKHSIAAGKNFHATGGFGPWIVTADEIPDPTRLHLVDAAQRQGGPAHRDRRSDLRHPDPDLVLLGLDAARRGRRDLYRHPRRGRLRPQAALVDEAGRCRRGRNRRRHRRLAQPDHRRELIEVRADESHPAAPHRAAPRRSNMPRCRRRVPGTARCWSRPTRSASACPRCWCAKAPMLGCRRCRRSRASSSSGTIVDAWAAVQTRRRWGSPSSSARAICRCGPAAMPNISPCRPVRRIRCRRAVDLEAAACLSNYQVAYHLLHTAARGVEAEPVLVHTAAGGVGSAAVQLALIAGMRVIGVAGSEAKTARGPSARRRARDQLPHRRCRRPGARGHRRAGAPT